LKRLADCAISSHSVYQKEHNDKESEWDDDLRLVAFAEDIKQRDAQKYKHAQGDKEKEI
jgi:hypothetical protein